MRSKWENWDSLILLGVFLTVMGVIFMLSDGLWLGLVMLISGIITLFARIAYLYKTQNEPSKPRKWKQKYDNPLWGGLLMFFIGLFMLISEIGTTFPTILLVVGGLLTIGTLLFAFVIDKEKQEISPKKAYPQQLDMLNDVTDAVYEESCLQFMNIFRELAEEIGKSKNFETNYFVLKSEIESMQKLYGYSLKNKTSEITAIALYYLLDTDKLIYLYTREHTTSKQYWDIVKLIENHLNDEIFNEDVNLFIRDIVDGYFLWGDGNPKNQKKNYTVRYTYPIDFNSDNNDKEQP